MKLHEISIQRPVAVLMCIMIVLVLGGVSFSRVPVDLMPSIDLPIAIVSTSYSGVGPQEIESIVTKSIENAIATVNNIKTIQSQSSEGSSVVIAEFNSGTDMDFATLQMREKIDLIKRYLPDEVDTPMVMKIDPAMLPIVSLGITNGKDEVELKKFIEDRIKPRLESLDGVASISVTGGKTSEIKVDIDPEKLSGYGLSFSTIVGVLQSENMNLPGGTVEYGDKKLLVRSTGEFSSVEAIKNVPIAMPQGNIIYIQDIADVKDTLKEQSTYTRMNRENSVGISVQKQTTANTVKVVNLVKAEIEKIKKENPDININLVFDQGKYVEQSINNVTGNAIIGGILAILILFIFLRNVRTTLIIGIAIPVSVISTFVLMFLSKTTLNLISMGGLALGVGMMVDNSIVVLENIFRHRQQGESRFHAAVKGAKEVGGAIFASTLTTVVVFVPIIFTEGMAAEIFKEMALTVTFSLLASLAVALTIVPMLSSKMLAVAKDEKKKKNILDTIFDAWGRFFNGLDNFYRKSLQAVLKHRKVTAFVVLIIFIASIAAVPLIGIEFIPATDQGQFTVNIKLPEGTLLSETDKVTGEVEKVIADIPEIEKMFVTVGGSGSMVVSTSSDSHTSSISATLVPKGQRKRNTGAVVEEIRNKVSQIPGADIKVSELSMSMGGGSGSSSAMAGSMGFGGAPISVEISGYDFEQLKAIAFEVEQKIKEVKGTRQIESSISKGRPEAQIYVDKDRASQYGINTMQVASTVRTALQGQVATRYRLKGDEIDVRVQLPENERKTYEQLKDIKITAPNGAVLTMGEIANINLEEGPVSIARKNQIRYVTVTSDLFKRDVGSATNEIKEKLKDISLPEGYSITFGGQNKQIQDSFSALGLALLLSLLLIYMVMAAQFESLLQPFIIMFSVPLAFSGAAIGLALTGRTFNVASFIGVIMLAGIVVNNAILLIDYINQLRQDGMERNEAVIKAGPTRLRPILMTTLTTVLGMIPLALGIGEGAEIQAPLATVVIFGLTMSTMLTLLIVPVVYTLFDDLHSRFKKQNVKTIKAIAVQE